MKRPRRIGTDCQNRIRLEGKDIFANRRGVVIPLLSREDFYARQSRQFVKKTFQDSLPQFMAAFIREKKLSDGEIEEILRLISVKRNSKAP